MPHLARGGAPALGGEKMGREAAKGATRKILGFSGGTPK